MQNETGGAEHFSIPSFRRLASCGTRTNLLPLSIQSTLTEIFTSAHKFKIEFSPFSFHHFGQTGCRRLHYFLSTGRICFRGSGGDKGQNEREERGGEGKR